MNKLLLVYQLLKLRAKISYWNSDKKLTQLHLVYTCFKIRGVHHKTKDQIFLNSSRVEKTKYSFFSKHEGFCSKKIMPKDAGRQR
jgi:hypothetical protein